ncbi:hypothetical protein KV557_13795 [Kitasatospora aureofaciens]|uniref:hypothetical protein n=1 Tax=Kitasatospora aureofaciens TaxID=1894 RepID=UPI001C44A453|nr:hypothetical protein [Kitasatospora aureofaciens]MBV6698199.1 hypothetical protein [Kitasatospora aureofaciens]
MSAIKPAVLAAILAASLALAFFAADLVPPREPSATADVVWWTTLSAALVAGINRHNDDDD